MKYDKYHYTVVIAIISIFSFVSICEKNNLISSLRNNKLRKMSFLYFCLNLLLVIYFFLSFERNS